MKGNNEILLNEATMIEALQEYFDKRMTTFAPVITNVGYRDREFKVSVKERENNNSN